MPNKMLIDASHPEETRVVVTRGNRIEEFDFESQDKKQLRGNIYLARVTRVEPSLQAAFVEYGGNRHGFLAFSEIHPDYYQIPVADRQALLRAEAEAAEDEDNEDEEEPSNRRRRRGRSGKNRQKDQAEQLASGDETPDSEHKQSSDADEGAPLVELEPLDSPSFLSNSFGPRIGDTEDPVNEDGGSGSEDDSVAGNGSEDSNAADEDIKDENGGSDDNSGPAMPASIENDVISEELSEHSSEVSETNTLEDQASRHGQNDSDDSGDDSDDDSDDDEVESVGAEDAIEEAQPRRRANRRQYKIQEVIKRRQILLVQVVKEERGNKGAALTTYLSLAGRYSVLMPNTARGGGISRKITNVQDRKRLKDVVKELDVPQGMGVILRTAGESRTKAEIKRDYEYLMRMWENVRTLTLESTAPALVYEEGSLIKRSVRDLYNKDIEEIQVAGEDGYREAKNFMRMLMPSHAKVVQPYRDTVPIFARNGIEGQLDRMLQPQVNLKSGGYIIINQTEALVAIDVNSGRSTKEHSIEDTALQTNLEAADEVARQLRLRDLAGLIVVDFIDMEENRNNRAVEKRMKDALKNDRARIQVGRISHFGLLEMSRQRIRASVLESTTQTCPHCGGTGHIRSESSVALHVIRAIEEYLLKDNRFDITVRTPVSTALYVLNHKRSTLVEIEGRFGVSVSLEADETLGTQHYAISKGDAVENPVTVTTPSYETVVDDLDEEVALEIDETQDEDQSGDGDNRSETKQSSGDQEGDRKRRRRRRRRGKDRDRESASEHPVSQAVTGDHGLASNADEAPTGDENSQTGAEVAVPESELDADQKKRRRGKRGGRRNRRDEVGGLDNQNSEAEGGDRGTVNQESTSVLETTNALPETSKQLAPSEQLIEMPIDAESSAATIGQQEVGTVETAVAAGEAEPPAKPKRTRTKRVKKLAEEPVIASETKDAQKGLETAVASADIEASVPAETASAQPDVEPQAGPKEDRSRPSRRRAATEGDTATEPVVTSSVPETERKDDAPRKAGWWQRKTFF